MKKVQLEPWSTFDKLCLISTMCKLKQVLGDQNWVAISRHTKQLNETLGMVLDMEKRNDEWFSVRQCAAQYEHLYKAPGTRKKKRIDRSENDSLESLETSLKSELKEELLSSLSVIRTEYLKSKQIVQDIDNDKLDDDRLEELAQECIEESRGVDIKLKLKSMLDVKNAENERAQIFSGSSGGDLTPPIPPPPAAEAKTSSTTSPLLTSLLQSPSPLVRSSLPSNSSPTISLLLHSSPPVPITDSTLSKLLETTPSIPTLSTPTCSQQQSESSAPVKNDIVESEVIIEDESPPSKKRRMDLQVEVVELENEETEEEVLETVEEIIERVEEAVIEAVGESGLGDLEQELAQSDEPITIDDSDIDQLEIGQDETVEVIVLPSDMNPDTASSIDLNNDTVIISGSPVKINDETVIIDDSDDSAVKITTDTIIINDSPVKITDDTVVLDDSGGKISSNGVVISNPVEIGDQALVISNSVNVDDAVVLNEKPLNITSQATLIDDSTGCDETTVIIEDETQNENVLLDESGVKITDGSAVIISETLEKMDTEALIIDQSPMPIKCGTVITVTGSVKEFSSADLPPESNILSHESSIQSQEKIISPKEQHIENPLTEMSVVETLDTTDTIMIEFSNTDSISPSVDSSSTLTKQLPISDNGPIGDINDKKVSNDSKVLSDDQQCKSTDANLPALDCSAIDTSSENTLDVSEKNSHNTSFDEVVNSMEPIIVDSQSSQVKQSDRPNGSLVMINDNINNVCSELCAEASNIVEHPESPKEKENETANELVIKKCTEVTKGTENVSESIISMETNCDSSCENTKAYNQVDSVTRHLSDTMERSNTDADEDDCHSSETLLPDISEAEKIKEKSEGLEVTELSDSLNSNEIKDDSEEQINTISTFENTQQSEGTPTRKNDENENISSDSSSKRVISTEEVIAILEQIVPKHQSPNESHSPSPCDSDDDSHPKLQPNPPPITSIKLKTDDKYPTTLSQCFVSVSPVSFAEVRSRSGKGIKPLKNKKPVKSKAKGKVKSRVPDKEVYDVEKPARTSRSKRTTWHSSIDSKPDSPSLSVASSDDDRDLRAWKKSILLVYNRLAFHKFASVFSKPITENEAPGYHEVVLRPMDLTTIKKNIENGIIRSTVEFQRDMLLMVQNALIYNKRDTQYFTMASDMGKDMLNEMEIMVQAIGDGVPLSNFSPQKFKPRGRSVKITEDSSKKSKPSSSDDSRSLKRKRTVSS